MIELKGRRVLVIEDESAITMLIEDLLADLGCVLIGIVARLPEAARRIEALDYDLVLLDVNLNGEQSFAVADTLVALGKPFVFSTGYGKSVIPEHLQHTPILQKPFRQVEFASALRQALGR